MIIANLLLIISIILSSWLAYQLNNKIDKINKYLLVFSASMLLGISIFHILPEVYEPRLNNIEYFLIFGFILQIILEFFSKGMEHGHYHQHTNNIPILLVISLSIHSLIEAIPLYNQISNDDFSLLSGIIFHNIPISFALTNMIVGRNKTNKIKNVLIIISIFSIMAPIGIVIGKFYEYSITNYLPYILAIIFGMFLHISTTIIFENDKSHKYNLYKFLIILLGIFISIII